MSADYAALCYSYGARGADGGVARGERKHELRDILEVRRGITTSSLLKYAPTASADRCLAGGLIENKHSTYIEPTNRLRASV